MQNNSQNNPVVEVQDNNFNQLEERLETLTLTIEEMTLPLPEEENPFAAWSTEEHEDSVETVIGTFQENSGFDPLNTSLNEGSEGGSAADDSGDIEISDSFIEISDLNSVDIVYKLNLKEYVDKVIEKTGQLARDMAFSFENGKIPEAFQENQTASVVDYLKDPLRVFPEGLEYLSESQAGLFERLHCLDIPAYDNLVSLLNEINQSAMTVDSIILIAFVAGMAAPKICKVIYKASNVAFMWAIINTPPYRDLMLELDKTKKVVKLQKKDISALDEELKSLKNKNSYY